MSILGLSLSPHDSSAAIIEDGAVSVAIEEEKLSRIRHCINYDARKYTLKDEAKYFDSNFLNPSVDFLKTKIDEFEKYFNKNRYKRLMKQVDMVIGSNILGTKVPIDNYINIDHHLAHAAHAFFTSPYTEAAVLVIDGSGDSDGGQFETVSLYSAKRNNLTLLEKVTGKINYQTNTVIALSNSVGVLYQNASVLCSFGPFGEGKLMGLASYGKPKYFKKYMKFCRKESAYYKIDNLGLYQCIKKTVANNSKQQNLADIASSVQKILNELVLFYAKRLQKITKQKNLCYAGGVALNATTNTKILEKTDFKHVYIPSAPGDSGVSIGAALYGYHQIAKNKRIISPHIPTAYMGNKYTDKEVKLAINKYKKNINVTKLIDNNDTLNTVANLLNENKIVAWFQGASEFGPRALGNRSIFANPSNAGNRDRLNKIKKRESFRPVAPIITSENLNNYFTLPKGATADSLPYMLFTLSPLNKKIVEIIPAVIHVDNTARLQVVSKDQNPLVNSLIEKFAKMSKVPVLINTSFNIKGESMVETPDDAIKTFIASGMDYLVLDNYLIKKYE